MEKTEKWLKWPIGKLHGHSVYIELPPGLSGEEHNREINKASLYLEKSFKNADFIEHLKEIQQED